VNIIEELGKTKDKIDELEARTINAADKVYRKVLLSSYNDNILKEKILDIEENFLRRGQDYTILKLFIDNFLDLEYVYRYDLKDQVSQILDKNVTIKDFVSQFHDNGFLVAFISSKESEVEEYLKIISTAISKIISQDKNIPKISYSVIQRNRHLDKKDEFIDMVLEK
jgi:hypothetical protein